MVVKATYKDGSKKEITDYTIEDGNNLKLNQTEITISYDGKTVKQYITVIANKLLEIKVTKAPNKTEYIVGQNFDKTGMIITGVYEDETTQEITEYTIENGTNLKKGQTSVTINYNEQTTTQPITVEEKTITGISINKKPTKTKYIQYKEELDLSGGSIKANYNDNSSEEIELISELIEVSGFDNTKVGKNTITVTYQSKTTTFEVEIIKEEVEEVVEPENSNFDNAKLTINSLKLYNYTDVHKDSKILLNVTINGIVKSSKNDSYEYYYYISSNSKETNIQDWVKITESQKSNDKIEFAIDIDDIKNQDELLDAEAIYLYIKEVALKGGNQSIKISDAIKMETEDDEEIIEIYIDDVKINNLNSEKVTGNNSESKSNKDETVTSSILPNTGTRKILVITLIVLIAGAIFYVKYKNLSRDVK